MVPDKSGWAAESQIRLAANPGSEWSVNDPC
jgi:hypothetical protein